MEEENNEDDICVACGDNADNASELQQLIEEKSEGEE